MDTFIKALFVALICLFEIIPSAFGASEVEIPSSFNPVGSGARSIGMGGAFIAVADDATAASWNPGGLIHLTLPEFSVVFSGFHRREDIHFGVNTASDGAYSISEWDNINYLSAVYPFGLLDRNMVISLTYQQLYDMNRKWRFTLDKPLTGMTDNWTFRQTGDLSALGVSYCIQLLPELSLGVTLNLWDDDITPNKWEKKYSAISAAGGMSLFRFNSEERHSFSGLNANIGVLWYISYKLSLGAVLKTPFRADVTYRSRETQIYESEPEDMIISMPEKIRNDKLQMPMSYGIGLVYKFSDHFFMSADVYRTEWNDFIYQEEDGTERSPLTGKLINDSDISPTHQIRLGAEYRIMNKKKGYIIPLRAGVFYDPAPNEGNPDDFYGFSLGSGFTLNDRFSADIAYQYRLGNDAGKYMLENLGFSEDADEHKIYFSVIFYP